MVRGRNLMLVCLLRAVALALLPAVGGDVIFRVPEVMVRPISGAKSVGIGPTNGSRAWEPERLGHHELEVQYEEYFVEHEVSAADARKAAALLQLEGENPMSISEPGERKLVTLLLGEHVPDTRAGCGVCSQRELQYCETRVLADHCCCERHYLREPFPWLPHTCYVGPHPCRPFARDCVRYTRLRDCCCYRKMAERWKSILSGSPSSSAGGASLLLLSMLLQLARL